MSPTVAVVVRASGRDDDHLERAAADVRAQTWTDWTLVVAVPESEDGTAAERLAKDDDRVTVARGGGRGALANAALVATSAELAVLHDDGSWHPDFLTRTVGHLGAHPEDLAVATRSEVAAAATGADPAGPRVRRPVAPHEPAVSLVSLVSHNFVPPVSLLFRRSAWERVGGYDETLPALEDWDFLLRLLVEGTVGFLDQEALAVWNVAAPDRETTTHDAVEAQLRDRYLRRGLAGDPAAPALGAQLALAHQLRGLAQHQQEHLDAVTTELRLELGRVRGELLLTREVLAELQEDFVLLSEQVLDAVEARPDEPARVPGPAVRAARRAARVLRRGRTGPRSGGGAAVQ